MDNSFNRSFSEDERNSENQVPRGPTAFDIPDLTNLIADFCDDDALSKISRVNKDIRKMIVEESKDRYIRILEYKYLKVCMVLESLMDKLQQGQIIDLEMIEDAKDGLKLGLSNKNFDHLSIYRKFLLNKQHAKNAQKPLRSLLRFGSSASSVQQNSHRNASVNPNLETNRNQTNPSQSHVNGEFLNSVTNINVAMPQNNQEVHSYSSQGSFDYMRDSTIKGGTGGGGVFHPKPDPLFNNIYTQNTQGLKQAYIQNDNQILEDTLYETLLRNRQQEIQDYKEQMERKKDLEKQCNEIMLKLNDKSASIQDAFDGFLQYKMMRLQQKFSTAVKKIKGDAVYDSDFINQDAIENQFFLNSITEKVSQNILLEPFRHPYVLRELKNVIADRLPFGFTDCSRFTGISSDFTEDLERQKIEMQQYYKIGEKINQRPENQSEYDKFIELEKQSLESFHQKLQKVKGNVSTSHDKSQSDDEYFTIKPSSSSRINSKTRSSSREDLYQQEPIKQQLQQQQQSMPLWKKLLCMPMYGQLLSDPIAMQQYRRTHYNKQQQQQRVRVQDVNQQK
eukprot:403358545